MCAAVPFMGYCTFQTFVIFGKDVKINVRVAGTEVLDRTNIHSTFAVSGRPHVFQLNYQELWCL